MAKKALKITGSVIAVLLVLVFGTFSYISSGLFIRTQVLPRVADALGTEVAVGDASFSALSSLELKNLRVGSEADPLLRANTIRVQYRALSILSKKVEVNEVLLDGVSISVTPEKLAALKQAAPAEEEAEPEKEKKPAPAKAPPELLVQNVRIRDMSLDYAVDGATGRTAVQVSALNLDLPLLADGSDFHLTLDTQARVVSGDTLDARLQNITLDVQGGLDTSLMPVNLSVLLSLGGMSGSAGPVTLDGRRIQFAMKMDGTAEHYNLKQLQLVEYDRETKDAELGAGGTLALQPAAASLDLFANIPAGSLLDLVGALAGGIDFGKTAIAYTGHVDMPAPGNVASRGELSIRDLSVATTNLPAMRPLQLAAGHDVAIDLEKQRLTLNRLDMNIDDAGRAVIGVKLEKPLQLDLRQPGGDAATRISVKVDRLDLTMLNALLVAQPDVRILSGEVNRAVNIDVEQGGRQVVVDVGGGGIDRLSIQQGDRRIGPLRINHEARLQLTDFKELEINHFQVELIPLAMGIEPAGTLQVGGKMLLSPDPRGLINVSVDGRGDRLLAVAKPFMNGMNLAVGQPRIIGKLALDLQQGRESPDLDLKLNVTGIEARAPELGLNRTLAMDIDAQLSGGILNGDQAHIGASHVRVNGLGQERLLDLGIAETVFSLSDMTNHPERVNLPIQYAVNNLELARLLPFIPPEVGVRRLAGTVNASGKLLLVGPAKSVRLETSSNMEAFDFALNDGTRLATPVSPSLDLKLDYAVGGIANVERCNFMLRQPGWPDPILDLATMVRFDTSMNPDVKNTVQITATTPIQLDTLEGLVIKPEPSRKAEQVPSAEAGGEARTAPASPPNLWIETSLAVEQATYRQMEISNLVVNATYRNGKLDPAKAYTVVNGGEIRAGGTCDLAIPAKPVYDLTIQAGKVPFDPVLASFVPRLPLRISGGTKSADIRLRGDGFDLPSLQENLTALVDVQIDRLVVEQMVGTFGRLTETLLLGVFNLGVSDLAFADGGLKLSVDAGRFGDHDIHLEKLLLRAPQFMLDGSGTVQLGGQWIPDIEIQTGFSDGKAASLRSEGFSIASENGPTGYHPGPMIPLKGDLTSLRVQAAIVTQVLVSAGKISAEDAMKANLANELFGVLSGEGGGLSGIFGGREGEGKPDVGETVGNILQGVLGGSQTDNKQDETKKSDVIGNVLQGIFGN